MAVARWTSRSPIVTVRSLKKLGSGSLDSRCTNTPGVIERIPLKEKTAGSIGSLVDVRPVEVMQRRDAQTQQPAIVRSAQRDQRFRPRATSDTWNFFAFL